MKKNRFNYIFIAAFLCCVIVPAICMNVKPMQISEIDNKLLTEWPGFDITLSNNEELSNYVSDRIGFREAAIEAYTELSDKLFHVMVHPLFMYGREGHIYYKDPTYIAGYQHMNTDKEYLNSFVDFLDRTSRYLKDDGIEFLYFLCPDKKSIYPEYFPTSINVNENNESLIEYMRGQLDNIDVDYIIPDEELRAAKKDEIVYNKLYDATHWNENGAFIGHMLIDEKVQSLFEDVPVLSKDDYDLSMEKETTLDIAKFTIDEDVPHYALKNDLSSDMTMYLYDFLECTDDTFYCHFTNTQCGNTKKLLVFTDSYFGNYHKFYQNRFNEVYFVHWHNYKYLQYYVNLFFPDMVIFETAERSISGEMIGTVDEKGEKTSTIEYENTYYEEAAKSALKDVEYSKTEDVKYVMTQVSGVTKEGDILKLNINEGDNIVSLKGYIDAGNDSDKYDVYANFGGEQWVESNYDELHDNSIECGLNQFAINVQRRYLFEEDITLVARNRENGDCFHLDTLKVRYSE